MTQGNSGAQNKLGELFVDFGTKGVGGLLKNLNSVSASFLLGKNAANQFAQTITQPIKQTGQYAMELRNLRYQMGLTNKEAQKIQNWAKKFNYNEGSVFGDISNLLDSLTQINKYNVIDNKGTVNIKNKKYVLEFQYQNKEYDVIAELLFALIINEFKKKIEKEFIIDETIVYLPFHDNRFTNRMKISLEAIKMKGISIEEDEIFEY